MRCVEGKTVRELLTHSDYDPIHQIAEMVSVPPELRGDDTRLFPCATLPGLTPVGWRKLACGKQKIERVLRYRRC
jgi:hypothetical protein